MAIKISDKARAILSTAQPMVPVDPHPVLSALRRLDTVKAMTGKTEPLHLRRRRDGTLYVVEGFKPHLGNTMVLREVKDGSRFVFNARYVASIEPLYEPLWSK